MGCQAEETEVEVGLGYWAWKNNLFVVLEKGTLLYLGKPATDPEVTQAMKDALDWGSLMAIASIGKFTLRLSLAVSKSSLLF